MNFQTRLVRHRKTRKYLKTDGTWTADRKEAHNFPSIYDVVRWYQRHAEREIDLVVVINGKEYTEAFPLRP
jgi:Holliday junction resolvase-like predicted endonuclease